MIGSKRRLTFDNDHTGSSENDGNSRKKSKLFDLVDELKSYSAQEDFINIRKVHDTISFAVNGTDGVVILVDITETKLTIRTIFIHYRETVVTIKRFVSHDTVPLIPMLLNFLSFAKKVNKKSELFACPNWNDFRKGS